MSKLDALVRVEGARLVSYEPELSIDDEEDESEDSIREIWAYRAAVPGPPVVVDQQLHADPSKLSLDIKPGARGGVHEKPDSRRREKTRGRRRTRGQRRTRGRQGRRRRKGSSVVSESSVDRGRSDSRFYHDRSAERSRRRSEYDRPGRRSDDGRRRSEYRRKRESRSRGRFRATEEAKDDNSFSFGLAALAIFNSLLVITALIVNILVFMDYGRPNNDRPVQFGGCIFQCFEESNILVVLIAQSVLLAFHFISSSLLFIVTLSGMTWWPFRAFFLTTAVLSAIASIFVILTVPVTVDGERYALWVPSILWTILLLLSAAVVAVVLYCDTSTEPEEKARRNSRNNLWSDYRNH